MTMIQSELRPELKPELVAEPISPDAETIRSLLAYGPSFHAAIPLLQTHQTTALQVERMHFPKGKPVQMHIRARSFEGDELLLAEWIGAEAAASAATESARLAKAKRGQTDGGVSPLAADTVMGLVLRRTGFDVKLPGLRLLYDPAFAREKLTVMGCGPDMRLTLVAHRLGKRAVFRIDDGVSTRYARLRATTSSSGASSYEQHLALWSALKRKSRLAIPRPLGFDPELGLALYAGLPGNAPVFAGLDGFRATKSIMAGLATLQSVNVLAPLHSAADELAILDEWAGRVRRVFPELWEPLRLQLTRLRNDLLSLPDMTPVACHRDLHEGQILIHRGKAGILDFDTLRLADPALDAGNLQAHLVLAGLRDGRSRAAFCTDIDRCMSHLPLRRMKVWRNAALLRLAMIYAFTSEPRGVIEGLIAESAS